MPNPFIGSTLLTFTVPQPSPGVELRLEIFDPGGRLVSSLVEEAAVPGVHEIPWDGTDQNGNPLGSGIYLARLSLGNLTQTRKLVMTR